MILIKFQLVIKLITKIIKASTASLLIYVFNIISNLFQEKISFKNKLTHSDVAPSTRLYHTLLVEFGTRT